MRVEQEILFIIKIKIYCYCSFMPCYPENFHEFFKFIYWFPLDNISLYYLITWIGMVRLNRIQVLIKLF